MRKPNVLRWSALALSLALMGSGCQQRTAVAPPAQQARTTSPQAMSAPRAPASTVVAAGDISPTWLGSQQATSDLVLGLDPTRVLLLGDDQYANGELVNFRKFYDPTWGRFKARTHPSPGNHEYNTPGALGYFSYFGQSAKPLGLSYYSFDLPGWHLISLDSNIDHTAASAQLDWLRQDLRQASERCVLAYWHHPRFSSGSAHGDDTSVAPFWRVLYRHRADVVLNGHEHQYERFAPQTPGGTASPAGIREFVVGTGGASHYPFGAASRNSQSRIANRYGVLRLVLRPRSYLWSFIGTKERVLDSGGPRRCH